MCSAINAESLSFLELHLSRSFAQNIDGDDFISKFATMVNSLLVKRQSISFGFIMTRLLEQKGVKVKSLDETSFGLKIDYSNLLIVLCPIFSHMIFICQVFYDLDVSIPS
ncbi:unnamed protein product [Malus baccata var. baccata]